MMKLPRKGITHGGVFHADDVFAYAFLHYLNPKITLQRVRVVPKDLDDDTIVFDIGGGAYDHHTPETIEFRDPALRRNPYSSFGKVVRAFKDNVFTNEKEYVIFDNQLCIPIDLQDCTGSTWHGVSNSLSNAIAAFRPNWNESASPADMDAAFFEAAKFAEQIVSRYILKANAIASSEIEVEKALKNHETYRNHFIVLGRYVNYSSFVPKDVNWALYPSARGGFQLYSVLEGGENRQLIPVDMVDGMRADPELVFVHPDRFTAVFKTRERAIEWAEKLGDHFDSTH